MFRRFGTPVGLGQIFPLATGGIALAYMGDVWLRDQIAAARARAIAKRAGKPLLNVGSGTPRDGITSSSATGAKLHGRGIPGSVNCDLAMPPGSPCGPELVCHCDAQNLSAWPNKHFSVALASNVLRYVDDRGRAMRELERVADHVVVSDNAVPWTQIGAGYRRPLNGIGQLPPRPPARLYYSGPCAGRRTDEYRAQGTQCLARFAPTPPRWPSAPAPPAPSSKLAQEELERLRRRALETSRFPFLLRDLGLLAFILAGSFFAGRLGLRMLFPRSPLSPPGAPTESPSPTVP